MKIVSWIEFNLQQSGAEMGLAEELTVLELSSSAPNPNRGWLLVLGLLPIITQRFLQLVHRILHGLGKLFLLQFQFGSELRYLFQLIWGGSSQWFHIDLAIVEHCGQNVAVDEDPNSVEGNSL